MSFPKLLVIITVILFGSIGMAALFKAGSDKESNKESKMNVISREPVEVNLGLDEEKEFVNEIISSRVEEKSALNEVDLPHADRIDEFFNTRGKKLPIVKTVSYKSRVSWQKGRPAWISDYASHYQTSRHFIARSLNGKKDYFKQDVSNGDQFNVLDSDVNFNFHLLVDLLRCKMWFYYKDLDKNSYTLLKTYDVGLGRPDDTSLSGLLTPVGTYTLGDKIAIYRPGSKAFYNGERVEMIQVFGTRWIPFEKEVGDCSASPKGYGIHGLPWKRNEKEELVELHGSIGKYESDGCIRLATDDIEEIFAIIITRPTTIELVKGFENSQVESQVKGE